MALSVVGVAEGGSRTGDFTVTPPAGAASYVAIVAQTRDGGDGGTGFAPPSGWSLYASGDSASGWWSRWLIYTAGSSPGSTWTFPSPGHCAVAMVGLDGPIDSISRSVTLGASADGITSQVCPSVSLTEEALVIRAVTAEAGSSSTASGNPAVGTVNYPSGTTSQIDSLHGLTATQKAARTDSAVHTLSGSSTGTATYTLTSAYWTRPVGHTIVVYGTGAPSSNSGTLTASLPLATASITGASSNPGTETASLPTLTGSISGTVIDPGILSATLPVVAGAASGTQTDPGTLTANLPLATGALTGTATNSGTITAALPLLTGSIIDTTTVDGTLTASLPPLTGSITGASSNPGTVNGTIPAMTGTVAGAQANPATLAVDIPKVTGTLTGTATNPATIAAALPKITGAITSSDINPGTLTGTLPLLTAALDGTSTNPGTLTGTLPAVVGSVGDQTVVLGTLSGTLPVVAATITAGGAMIVGDVFAPSPPLRAVAPVAPERDLEPVRTYAPRRQL